MNRDIHEELSRLLAGDLPPERADALRTRIDADPEVARAWRGMQALTADLDDHPLEPPPEALDRRVLAGTTPARSAPSPLAAGTAARRLLPLAAAAAVMLALLWPRSTPDLILAGGSQYVSGQVDVVAADIPVAVDGVALIAVEPADVGDRVPPQEDDMLDRNTVIAAVAGAAVTVAVYEGSAILGAGTDDPRIVRAGETVTVGDAPASRGFLGRRGPRDAAAAANSGTQQLTDEIARLEDELEQLRMEATMARGQLGHYEGTAQPWPEDLPAAFQPDAMAEALDKALAGSEELELLELDCAEFPCVAVIRSHAPGTDWLDEVRGRLDDTDAMGFEQGAGISIWASNASDEAGDVKLVGYAATPPEAMDEDAHSRTNFRANQLLADTTEGILEEHAEP